MRRIAAIVFIGLMLTLTGSIMYWLKGQKKEKAAIEMLIPANSDIVLKSSNFASIWEHLHQDNLIWSELRSTHSIQSLHRFFTDVDSLFLSDVDTRSWLTNETQYLFIDLDEKPHPWAFAMNMSDPSKALNWFQTHDGITTKALKDGEMLSFETKNFKGHLFVYDNVVFVGDENQDFAWLKEDSSFLHQSEPDFINALNSSGVYEQANLFIKFSSLYELITPHLNHTWNNRLNGFEQFGDWCSFDITVKPNYIAFDGWSFSNDSTTDFLGTFKNQTPQTSEIFEALPTSTAQLVLYSFSDFKNWYEEYKNFLSSKGKLQSYQEQIEKMNSEANASIDQHILSWVEGEVARVSLETKPNSPDRNEIALLKCYDIEYATAQLKELAEEQTVESALMEINDYEINKIGAPKMLENLFGSIFKGISGFYYTRHENYFIFADSPQHLYRVLRHLIQEQTLDNDETWKTFTHQIYDEHQISIISNIPRSISYYQQYANETLAVTLSERIDLLRQFEGFVMQFAHNKGNRFSSRMYFKHNPVYKESTKSIWEVSLDTAPAIQPHLVKNHYTKKLEVFIQDQKNQIYLISNTGQQLWKTEIKEPIKGGIQQIDIFGNDKLQIAFSTDHYIYLIDRLGRLVDGFPIEVKEGISAPVSILDYEKDHNYRLLVSDSTGKIHNYTKEGKSVKGWKQKSKAEPLAYPIHYFKIKKRDYLLCVDTSGNIYALNRRGALRHTVKKNSDLKSGRTIKIQKAKQLDKSYLSYVDTAGYFNKIYFNGEVNQDKILGLKNPFNYILEDYNQNGVDEVVSLTVNQLRVMDLSNNEILEIIEEFGFTGKPNVFHINENSYLGAVSKNGEGYLFNQHGIMPYPFPVETAVSFALGDMNLSNHVNVVSCTNQGTLFMYELDE